MEFLRSYKIILVCLLENMDGRSIDYVTNCDSFGEEYFQTRN